ncbi:hypothetical protein GF378_02870 [Candidatus Pacearchaeota archaeon]|nr:hypothetical protein [Candidatus Pacearchaeota archaeon]
MEREKQDKEKEKIKNVPYIRVQESCCAYREGKRMLKDQEGGFYFDCMNYEKRRGAADEFDRDNICPTCNHSGLLGEGLFDSDSKKNNNSLEEISE